MGSEVYTESFLEQLPLASKRNPRNGTPNAGCCFLFRWETFDFISLITLFLCKTLLKLTTYSRSRLSGKIKSYLLAEENGKRYGRSTELLSTESWPQQETLLDSTGRLALAAYTLTLLEGKNGTWRLLYIRPLAAYTLPLLQHSIPSSLHSPSTSTFMESCAKASFLCLSRLRSTH